MKLQNLNEVFVIGGDVSDAEHVLAYRQYVWLINDHNFDELKDDIEQKTRISVDDVWDYNNIAEKRVDIVFGSINNNYLELQDTGNYRHSVASKLLANVVKELDLYGVKINFWAIEDTDEYEISRSEFLEPLKTKVYYHGTCYEHYAELKRFGIRPQSHKTNFSKIRHEDKVFVTLNKEKAHFHALKCAQTNDSFPIILELKIPDISKLVLDYDVAIDIYGKDHNKTIELGYSDILDMAGAKPEFYGHISKEPEIKSLVNRTRKDPDALNTSLGVFGYIGRIPSKFITGVLFDEENFKQFSIASEYDYLDDMNIEYNPIEWWSNVSFDHLDKFYDEAVEEYRDEMEDEEEEDFE